MFEAALPQVQLVERLMSTFRAESDVSRLNQSGAQEPVTVSQHTLRVLRKAVEVSGLTDGAFDVTYAPLRTLWRRAQREGRMPSPDAVSRTLQAVGWSQLTFDGDRVGFAVEGMEVDLGGIAKGYAIDLAADGLQGAGAAGGIVDIGGDLRLFGAPEPGRKWRVKVREPPGVDRDWVLVLPACAVATSGDYARWFRIGEQRLSHILDPRTGRPVAGVSSATVTAPDAVTADALATAMSVIGPDGALAMVDSLPGVECMIMAGEAEEPVQVHMSAGFAALVEGS
jgi:thiamine biosynthesis lipoprotein